MTIQQMLLRGFTQQSTVIYGHSTPSTVSNQYTGSITSPIGSTTVIVEAIGGGGTAYGHSTAANRAGGGGGQYARSGSIVVTGGTTIVYYSAGGSATQSWCNVGANSAPTSSTTGCLAPAGTNASIGVAGVGNSGTAIAIANGTAVGGNGVVGSGAVGGGAGGAGSNIRGGVALMALGQSGGTDTTGILDQNGINTPMTGGDGGNSAATSTVGVEPGGGGGGSVSTGTNRLGAIGRVRITFN